MMIRKINPIIIINGIFLLVMILLFGRFLNTGRLFSSPAPLDRLEAQLTGHFFSEDSVYELNGHKIQSLPGEPHAVMLGFVVSPSLDFPWKDGWLFKLSNFGSGEWIAEEYDSTGLHKWTGCELVFRVNGQGFLGETVGTECESDSMGNPVTLSLRSAPDSLIFATHRKNPNGGEDIGQEILFLRQLTDKK